MNIDRVYLELKNKKLRPLKQKQVKIATFDIETHDWIYPYAVGFYDGQDYKEFLGKKCVSDFLKFVLHDKYRAYTIFAHNGGRFDFNFLLEYLKNKKYDMHLIFQGSSCIRMKIYHSQEGKINNRNNRNQTVFADSYALLKFSLDRLTKDFNVMHKKINFMDKQEQERDYDYLYRLYKENDNRFYEYLKNDVLGLYEVIESFERTINDHNGIMSMTIASTALKTFQSGYLQRFLKMSDYDTNIEMKKAYYGGRTEIFRMFLPDGKYNCYDINSLYPYVMFNNDFPISRPIKILNTSSKTIFEKIGISECTIQAPDDIYFPVLPYRKVFKNYSKLIFPVGKFRGYWDHSLLKKAYELGYKINIHKTYIFQSDYIFEDYVKDFYKLKNNSEKDTPSYLIAKLMLNSLYGKFGQNQDTESIVKINNSKELLKHEIVGVVSPDYNLFKVKSRSKGSFFLPQISIHVTALSQLRLYDFIEKLADKENIVAYCDTDSIFTDGKLSCSNRLGDMKLEYPFYKGYFLLPKTYCIKKSDGIKIKAKGFIGEFAKQLTENDFSKAIFHNDLSGFCLESNSLKFNSIKTSNVRHHCFVSTDNIKKSIHSNYDKRTILPDLDTKPLKI